MGNMLENIKSDWMAFERLLPRTAGWLAVTVLLFPFMAVATAAMTAQHLGLGAQEAMLSALDCTAKLGFLSVFAVFAAEVFTVSELARREVSWVNTAGQQITGTALDLQLLHVAQKQIDRTVTQQGYRQAARRRIRTIVSHMRPVAKSVHVGFTGFGKDAHEYSFVVPVGGTRKRVLRNRRRDG